MSGQGLSTGVFKGRDITDLEVGVFAPWSIQCTETYRRPAGPTAACKIIIWANKVRKQMHRPVNLTLSIVMMSNVEEKYNTATIRLNSDSKLSVYLCEGQCTRANITINVPVFAKGSIFKCCPYAICLIGHYNGNRAHITCSRSRELLLWRLSSLKMFSSLQQQCPLLLSPRCRCSSWSQVLLA